MMEDKLSCPAYLVTHVPDPQPPLVIRIKIRSSYPPTAADEQAALLQFST
jgi:hypothetical protein